MTGFPVDCVLVQVVGALAGLTACKRLRWPLDTTPHMTKAGADTPANVPAIERLHLS